MLAGGGPGPADPVVAPSAESPPATEIAHFSGTMGFEDPGEGEVETLSGRMIERGSATWSTDVDDARLSGSAKGSYYTELVEVPEGGGVVSFASSAELTNDGGSFSVECSGLGTVGYVASAGGTGGYLGCWYSGHDGYDGLTAFAVYSSKIPSTGMWNAEGWIYPGDPPALP